MMAIRLYISASDKIIQEVANVSPEIAASVQTLHTAYETADMNAILCRNRQEQERLSHIAYITYKEAVRILGPSAVQYADIAFGGGFNRFCGTHLVSDRNFGTASNPFQIIQILEAQQRWVDGYTEDYRQAFITTLKRAERAAIRGDLTVFWTRTPAQPGVVL
jgi:hypothetical protein